MTTDFIYGIIVPILTPIDEDERIREAKLREQVDFVIDSGFWQQWRILYGGRG